MTARQVAMLVLLGGGSLLALGGSVRLFLRERHATLGRAPAPGARNGVLSAGRLVALALVTILAVGLALRLWDLGARGMNHSDVYVPGITLPAGISVPPPRQTVMDVVQYHWHQEPHPQAYYFLTFAWTKVFGTGLSALRMPSVLFGVGCVLLTFILGARLFGTATGLVSAGFVALHGHWVYWSQLARPYAMASFLGLLSTLLLVDLLRTRGRAPGKEALYVVVTWLALFTQIYAWPLLAAHILAVLRYGTATDRPPRLLALQGMTIMLGTPMIAHAIVVSRPSDFLGRPSYEFLRDYVGFGFLFEPDLFSLPERAAPAWLSLGLLLAAVGLLVAAIRRGVGQLRLAPASDDPLRSSLAPIAAGMAVVSVGLAAWSWVHRPAIIATAAVPAGTWLALRLGERAWPAVSRATAALRHRAVLQDATGLLFLLAFVPLLLLSAVSLVQPLLTSRSMLIFSPYLIVALCAGGVALARNRVIAGGLATAGLVAALASSRYYHAVPEPNDYQGIARQMRAEFESQDLLFVLSPSWVTTPLFYHLGSDTTRLVTKDFAEALRQRPGARVWMVLFSDQEPPADMTASLAAYTPVRELTARRAVARLYLPTAAQEALGGPQPNMRLPGSGQSQLGGGRAH